MKRTPPSLSPRGLQRVECQTSDVAAESPGFLALWPPTLLSGALKEAFRGYCHDTKPQERDKTRHMERTKGTCTVVIVCGLLPLRYRFLGDI